jgi:hypothetical protein
VCCASNHQNNIEWPKGTFPFHFLLVTLGPLLFGLLLERTSQPGRSTDLGSSGCRRMWVSSWGWFPFSEFHWLSSRPDVYIPSPSIVWRPPSIKRSRQLPLSCYDRAPRPLALCLGCLKGVAELSTRRKRLPRLRLNCFARSSPKPMVVSLVSESHLEGGE